jgi:EpsI family protein
LTVYALWIAVVAAYWPSARDLNALWTNPQHEEAFTHGYLILLISLWLVFRERKRLTSSAVAPSPKVALILLMLSALWLWLWRAAIQEGHEMLLPVIWLTAITAALGWRIGRLLVFPVGYLYFAMPIWSDINGLVQTLSAKMTGALIFLTGLPAFMQGDYVQLPGGAIEIASTCSGLHALIVGLALATLYGKVADVPLRRRWLWIAVMGALSLVVNWIRIFTVITAAVFTEMHSPLVRHHYWLGWWLFAGAFALFLWWTGRKSQLARDGDTAAGAPVAAGAATPAGNRTVTVLATLAALALLPLTSYGLDWLHADAAPVSIRWPKDPAGWQASSGQGSEWAPQFRHPSAESLRRYTDANGRAVEVFTVAYHVQTQDAKLLSFWNHLLAGEGHFREKAAGIVNAPSGKWRELRVVDESRAQSLIWTRYRIGDRLFVEPRLSQLWYGLRALVSPPISSLTALRTDCSTNCRGARRRLAAASRVLPPALEPGAERPTISVSDTGIGRTE